MMGSKFADKLSGVIGKRKLELNRDTCDGNDGELLNSGKKQKRTWIRRSELLSSSQIQPTETSKSNRNTLVSSENLRQDNTIGIAGSNKNEDGNEDVSKIGLSELHEEVVHELVVPSLKDVEKRLRARGAPKTLFGEDEKMRFARLRELELTAELNTEYSRGQRNVLQQKLRENEAKLRSMRGIPDQHTTASQQQHHKFSGNTPKTASNALETAAEAGLGERTEKYSDEDEVLARMDEIIKLWRQEVSQETGHTAKARLSIATFEQTVEYLRPLQRKLRKKTVGNDMLRALKEIFQHVHDREYVRANDVYLRLAIGNAPWPVGATQVGIHARSAREKIGEENVAHIMNDEQTRKFIQAAKRLITKAQTYFPTVPSKMICS